MTDQIKKRQIIITFNDFCSEPFEVVDKDYFNRQLRKVLEPYDVEVISVEVKDVTETQVNSISESN